MIPEISIPTLVVPAGYIARPATMDDIPAAVRLFNAQSQMLLGVDQHTETDQRVEWQDPHYQLEWDSQTIWTEAGQLVAYAEFYNIGEPHARLFGWTAVHPEFLGRGLGSALNDWIMARARNNVPLAAGDVRVVLHCSVLSTHARAIHLYESKGFHHERSFYRMRIDFDGPYPAPQPVAGIEIRPMRPEDERTALYADYDAFLDHWGFVAEPFESYFERMTHYAHQNEHHDPSLWFLAWDGDEVAGVSLCDPRITEDAKLGWVGTLGVRRAWRKRGLGLMLLQHSFVELQKRGQPAVGLGVDASSLTGATRLYEKAGMRIYRQYNLYELELRSGRDLMKQSI